MKVAERDRSKLTNAKDAALEFVEQRLELFKVKDVTRQVLFNKYKHKTKTKADNHALVAVNAAEIDEAGLSDTMNESKDDDFEYIVRVCTCLCVDVCDLSVGLYVSLDQTLTGTILGANRLVKSFLQIVLFLYKCICETVQVSASWDATQNRCVILNGTDGSGRWNF